MVCDCSPKGNSINSPHSNSFATVIRRWRSVLSNIYRKTHCGSLIIKLQALYLPGSVKSTSAICGEATSASDCFASMVASQIPCLHCCWSIARCVFSINKQKKAEEVALFRLVTCYLSLTGFQ